MYLSVTNLIELLSYKFAMNSPEHINKRITDNPDVALICLTVIAAKTWYGFDKVKRHPRDAEDISATLPDWDTWKAHLEDLGKDEKSPKRPKHWELNLDERELYDMSNEDLDLYMDWYERTYYSAEGGTGKGKAPRQILRFFEDENYSTMVINDQDEENSQEISKEFQRLCNLNTNNLTHIDVIPDDDQNVLRSGHEYIMFNPDRHQDLPPKMKVFLKAAAVCIGLPFKLFLKELYHMECRCLLKERELRKKENLKAKAAMRGDDGDNHDDEEQTEAQAGDDAMVVEDHEEEGNKAAEGRILEDAEGQINQALSRMSDADINDNDRAISPME